jgi:hypothetical protein
MANEENYDYPPEFFYRVDNPCEKEKLLAQKTAEMVKKVKKNLWKMTTEELNKYWKPLFIECGLEWKTDYTL